VLFRSAFEEAMRRQGCPYRLVGAVRFYDRREIRDLMSYLKLIANPADNEAFRRAVTVPRRGLGDTALAQLTSAASARGISLLQAAGRGDVVEAFRPALRTALTDFAALVGRLREQAAGAAVDELLRSLVDGIRYGDYLRAEGPEAADRLENVRELMTGAAEIVVDEGGEVGLTPLEHFLQHASLVAAIDQLDPEADAVTLMTVHNAKGLEFPVVFIAGLEDGLFPLARAFDEPKMLEEERRLFYVGITRAEQRLYLSHAELRRRNGELLPAKASIFLTAVPPGLLEQRETVKVRSSGRLSFTDAGRWPSTGDSSRPSVRRPGTPVMLGPRWGEEDAAEVSQDAPQYVVGERVRHRTFGTGTIAELTGAGRDSKARIDFEDPAVGRKTLVIVQAGLQRALE
jgi:DNA helicase-2/ATP-dependent DNA helicase PcrA